MVEPGVDVLSTFLENLLPEDHGCRRCVRKEVVVGNVAVVANSGPSVVTKMEYAGFDTEPECQERVSD